VTGNCKNGLFAYPTGEDAFAEAFVNFEDGGGIGAWSPTGLGYGYWHDNLARHLYRNLFQDYVYQLGQATTSAKIKGFAELGRVEPVEIFTLFGDPAVALHIVQPGLNLTKTAMGSHVKPGESLTYILTYANNGNYPADNVVVAEDYDPHTTFVEANPSPSQGDDVWQLGTLAPDASGTITITVQVSPTVPGGTTLLNTATMSGDELEAKVATANTVVAHYGTFIPLVLGK
jgi:uncharacterized repeat protein (TIGR01451 family)